MFFSLFVYEKYIFVIIFHNLINIHLRVLDVHSRRDVDSVDLLHFRMTFVIIICFAVIRTSASLELFRIQTWIAVVIWICWW